MDIREKKEKLETELNQLFEELIPTVDLNHFKYLVEKAPFCFSLNSPLIF